MDTGPQVSGVGFQVSGFRCQVSGVRDFRFQVSGVSGVRDFRCQVSGAKGSLKYQLLEFILVFKSTIINRQSTIVPERGFRSGTNYLYDN